MKETKIDVLNLFSQYNKQIFNYVYFRVGCIREDAEDISSEVFLRAIKYSESYNPEYGTEKTWLFTIARNLLKDHYSKRSDNLDFSEIEESFLKDFDNNDTKLLVNHVISELKNLETDDKDLIVMKYIIGLKNKEISELVNKNEDTVKVSVHRAKQKLLNLINS